ncbi:MAG: DUF1570 domain-containing protein, partial [Planctomycetota bacterium]
MKKLLIVIAVLILFVASVSADTVLLKNGKRLEGKIIEEDKDKIELRTEYGVLTIPRADIETIDIELAELTLTDKRVLQGVIVSESETELKLKTKHSELVIHKNTIVNIKRPAEFLPRTVEMIKAEIASIHSEAIDLLKQKKYEESIALYQKILDMDAGDMIALYNVSCAYSLTGEIEKAIRYLEDSIEAGFLDFGHMQRDVDLDNIRKTLAFEDLMIHKEQYMRIGASKQLSSLKNLLGKDYVFEIDRTRKLVFAVSGNQKLLEMIKNEIDTLSDALWGTLFMNRPAYFLVIIYPNKEDCLKFLGKDSGIGGYYNDFDKRLVCSEIGNEKGGILRHEFTHALHYADMSVRSQFRHPMWIAEGLATCFECSEIKDGKIYPIPSTRVGPLKEMMYKNEVIPFESLMKYDYVNFMKKAEYTYAEVRYIIYYLFEKGKLLEWYETYCNLYNEDPTGILSLEKILGKKIEEIEKEWIAWAK